MARPCVLLPSSQQVQLLHREGTAYSPAATTVTVNGGTSGIGTSAMGEGGAEISLGLDSAAGEKRFAEMLNARLSEERHVQVTLAVSGVGCFLVFGVSGSLVH